MTVWELRQRVEMSLPWWMPFAAPLACCGLVLLVHYFWVRK